MQKFAGTGEMLIDGKHIARIRYDLHKQASHLDVGGDHIDGRPTTTGWITPLGEHAPFDMSVMCTLRRANGIELEFYLTRTAHFGIPRARYEVTVIGDPEE